MAATRLFYARNENWGLIGPNDWTDTVWTVYESGACTAKSRFSGRPDTVTHKTVLSAEMLEKLRVLLATEWEPFTRACDGDAWTFRTYDSDGHVADEIGPGYIYGCPTLEAIAVLLPSQGDLIRFMEKQFWEEDAPGQSY